jgi:hypothetical protein
MGRRKCELLSGESEPDPIIVKSPDNRPVLRTLILEFPKPSTRYSYSLFAAEVRRDIRWGIFGHLSERDWETALARREVVISPSGSFVTVNAIVGPAVIVTAFL